MSDAVSRRIGFVGLGNMGSPMVRRLAGGGHDLRVFDISEQVRATVGDIPGVRLVDEVACVAEGADIVILMLPDSNAVESVLHDRSVLEAVPAGALVVDMGSSEPIRTRELAKAAAGRGVRFIDAPVSGGVAGAVAGTLTVMAGGATDDVAAVRPVLELVGAEILHAGPTGAGHAVKALNNLMSATHLLASTEALQAATAFGLDQSVVLDIVNRSSGRSASTEVKFPRFVLTERYDSGFAMALMLKDMRIALGLAESSGTSHDLTQAAVSVWAEAVERMPRNADHTEITRWVAKATPVGGR